MHAAGSMANFIYAKLDIKQFKTVNTSRGPWALLEGLENVEDNPSRTIKIHKDANISLKHLEALSHAPMAQPLHEILDIVRKVAIGLIGSENLEGRICHMANIVQLSTHILEHLKNTLLYASCLSK